MTAKIARLRPNGTKAEPLDLTAVVAALRHSREVTHNIRLGGKVTEVPAVTVIAECLDGIVMALFPTHLGPHGVNQGSADLFVTNALSTALLRLGDQVARGLRFDAEALHPRDAQIVAERIVQDFAKQLATIRALLVSDLRAAQRRDPSAASLAEILICYPSTRAIIHHRLAHVLHAKGARFIARTIAALAHATTGIDIHPGAQIGQGFFIRKGMGVTIGESAVIGDNVTLHQGVTLGDNDDGEQSLNRTTARHPIVENNVIIHAGATILGRITVGAGSVIGGNVWLTRSVPPGSAVTQAAHAMSAIQTFD
jgi:serine O-acetyltransferase